MKKKFKLGLMGKVLLGILLGILSGSVFPELINRILVTVSTIFSNYIGFVIPFMILGFVTMGIADLSSGAGKLLVLTVGLSYISTLLAGSAAYIVSANLFPSFISKEAVEQIASATGKSLEPLITLEIKPFFDTFSAVIFAFIMGLCLSYTKAKEKNSVLYRGMSEFSGFIQLVLDKTIIPMLPFYVMGTFANMAYSGQAVAIAKILWRVFLVVIILHLLCLFVQFGIASFISKKNFFELLKKEFPAYLTAIGTQSSAATIPTNLECAKAMGIPASIRNFTVPLCANVHMSGSMITIVSCSVAVLLMHDLPIGFSTMFPFMCTLAFAMVASPGAPGGSIMTALPFLPMVGISTQAMQSLMVSLYIAQDSFGTACNVSGDNALGLVVTKVHQHFNGDESIERNS